MNVVSVATLRKKLNDHLDEVYDNHDVLIITRKDNRNLVLISIEDYNALIETNYLLSSPANAQRLTSALKKARAGMSMKKELLEE